MEAAGHRRRSDERLARFTVTPKSDDRTLVSETNPRWKQYQNFKYKKLARSRLNKSGLSSPHATSGYNISRNNTENLQFISSFSCIQTASSSRQRTKWIKKHKTHFPMNMCWSIVEIGLWGLKHKIELCLRGLFYQVSTWDRPLTPRENLHNKVVTYSTTKANRTNSKRVECVLLLPLAIQRCKLLFRIPSPKSDSD